MHRVTTIDANSRVGTYLVNYGVVTTGMPNQSQGILRVYQATFNNKVYKEYRFTNFTTNKQFVAFINDEVDTLNWNEL